MSGSDAKPACCIVYTSDETYLFPTLISAIQARRHASAAKADVMICHFRVSPQAERDFAAVCRNEDIRFMAVSPALIDHAPAMMARLFLTRFMPAHYTQLLYIDGDVHVTGSLDPLVEAEVPIGHFMAANDPMTFMLAEGSSLSTDLTRHLHSLGFGTREAGSYFNTGVLRINRTGWEELGLRAWQLARAGAQAFRFPDQDPLNLAAGDRRISMSLAWNFPIFMRNARVETAIRPCMYHFMSNPKPWQGDFPPWSASGHAPYPDILHRYPVLAAYNPRLPLVRRLRYHLQQRYKQAVETLTWGFTSRRRRILHYEQLVASAGQS